MKVVILAGGFGTRLGEHTKHIPKPMIKICGKPILIHIINHYYKYGFKDFIIATGYKQEVIKKYFKKKFKFKVKIIFTGKKTMTGGRILRLKKYLNEPFMLTYGDGVSNINLKKLLSFHNKNKKIATLSAVRPPARFGAVKINKNTVKYFKEKSKLDEGWINGGFFVMDPKILNYIKNDTTFLEKEPLVNLSKKNQLNAYKHHGYWQCMDTYRDKLIIESHFKKK